MAPEARNKLTMGRPLVTESSWLVAVVLVFAMVFLTTVQSAEAAHLSPTMPAVVEVTKANFHGLISSRRYVFLGFYFPSCETCTKLAPTLAELAQAVTNDTTLSGLVTIGKVNTDTEGKLVNRFFVRVVPVFYLVHPNATTITRYTKGRTAKKMLRFIKEEVGLLPRETKNASLRTGALKRKAANVTVLQKRKRAKGTVSQRRSRP